MVSVLGLCYNQPMSQAHRKSVTKEQWDEAAASYELGYQNGAQIARELGVSPATVCREFKRRGSRKGSRVGEVVAELVAKLEAEARERQAKAEAKAAAINALASELVDAVFAADQAGDITMANRDIARIDKALQLAMR
jgi:IS30 family transposase